ncbi:MAG: tetratricopeptide repeat protein, partial [Alphaproteobacteria bacterium]
MPLRNLILPMLVIVWLWPGPANAMSPELEATYQEFRELHAQHRYKDALPVARKAVSLAEREYGPDHPNTATFLSNLATVYQGLGKDAEAESLVKRALAIYGISPLSQSRHIVNVLGNYAVLLRKMGRHAEAEKIEARAKETKSKARAKAALAKLQKKKPAGVDTSDFKKGDFKKGLDAYL